MTTQISIRFQHEQPRGTGVLTNQNNRNIACDHQFHIQSFYQKIGCQKLVMINYHAGERRLYFSLCFYVITYYLYFNVE